MEAEALGSKVCQGLFLTYPEAAELGSVPVKEIEEDGYLTIYPQQEKSKWEQKKQKPTKK